MKTILVPTDGSTAADKALDVALDLALSHQASVKLMHVLLRDKEPEELLRLPELADDAKIIDALHALADGPKTERTAQALMANPNLPERPAPDSLLQDIGVHVLDRASDRATGRGIAADILSLADGSAAAAIADAARETGADTIVMGMRGLRNIDAFTFGSVSHDVCRSVQCTCIAVH